MSHFGQLLAALKQTMPITHNRLVVRRCSMRDYGRTTLSGRGTITITVNKQLSHIMQLDTLAHEWAHAVLFDTNSADEQHGSDWGRCYAKAYRVYEATCKEV